MIRVMAFGQYEFSDLQRIWVTKEVVTKLAEYDITLVIIERDEVCQFIRSGQVYDVFVVDKWSHKCSEDVVALSRLLHPTVPIVMTRSKSDRPLYQGNEVEEGCDLVHFQDGSHEAHPASCTISILVQLGLMERPQYF